MGYNVGTSGYATGGASGSTGYGVGKGYSRKVEEEYSRSDIYKKSPGTGMPYASPSDRMEGLAQIAFSPKIDVGRSLK